MTQPTDQSSREQEREAFEAWYRRTLPKQLAYDLVSEWLSLDEDGRYDGDIQTAWEGWQALSTLPPIAITAEEAGREGDGWLPIETAPKDGTHILVSWPMRKMDDDGMPTGEITRRDTLVTWMNGNAWIEPDYLGASGEWYGDDDCYAVDPDFWQPLPSAPAQSGGQG